jgi:16S rRNA (guanine966-N2)-methyltransferase
VEFLTGVDRVEQDGRVDSGFDLVFVDPPYRYPEAALASVLEQLTHPHRWLADGAVIVVERAGKSGPPQWPSLIRPIKDKRYGDTVLWYASTG